MKRLWFQLILFILAFQPLLFANVEAVISTSSNIEGKSLYIFTQPSQLLRLDLESKKVSKISMGKDLLDLEVMALYQTLSNLFVIAQWTKGDGKPPVVYSMDIKSKIWTNLGTIDCVSFDKLIIEKQAIKLNCEEINSSGEGYKYSLKGLETKFKFLEAVHFELPLSENSNNQFKFQLNGTPTQWSNIQIYQKNKGKWTESATLSAADIIKKSSN